MGACRTWYPKVTMEKRQPALLIAATVALVALALEDVALHTLVVVLAERAADIDLIRSEPTLVVPSDVALVALMRLNEFSLSCWH